MDKNEQLFLNFIEGLVKYSPKDFDEGMGTVYERIMINKYFNYQKMRNAILISPICLILYRK